MPISPFLQGRAFDPETTKAMGAAFESACATLGLIGKRDRATELVAKEIIDAAETGVHDADKLALVAIRKYVSPSS
jgi:hypothetical protein